MTTGRTWNLHTEKTSTGFKPAKSTLHHRADTMFLTLKERACVCRDLQLITFFLGLTSTQLLLCVNQVWTLGDVVEWGITIFSLNFICLENGLLRGSRTHRCKSVTSPEGGAVQTAVSLAPSFQSVTRRRSSGLNECHQTLMPLGAVVIHWSWLH